MKRVLIVDDVTDIVDILRIVLQKDYEVQHCTRAEEIAGAIQNFQPHVILLDNQIGARDAGEIVSGLRQQIPGFCIPFIIFTGSMDAAAIAEKTGAAGYIEKPSDINHIREYIRKVLS